MWVRNQTFTLMYAHTAISFTFVQPHCTTKCQPAKIRYDSESYYLIPVPPHLYIFNLIASSSAGYLLACHSPLTVSSWPTGLLNIFEICRKVNSPLENRYLDLKTNSWITALEILSLSSLHRSILPTTPRRSQSSTSSSFWSYSILFAALF